jgi:FixJ family two-component response regulator
MQPLALMSILDVTERKRVRKLLRKRGCKVVELDSGYHLVEALSQVILGGDPAPVHIVVVDAISPGCSGVTIAAGLRDLGVDIPVVLIWPTADAPPPGFARGAIHVEPATAAAALIGIASMWIGN